MSLHCSQLPLTALAWSSVNYLLKEFKALFFLLSLQQCTESSSRRTYWVDSNHSEALKRIGSPTDSSPCSSCGPSPILCTSTHPLHSSDLFFSNNPFLLVTPLLENLLRFPLAGRIGPKFLRCPMCSPSQPSPDSPSSALAQPHSQHCPTSPTPSFQASPPCPAGCTSVTHKSSTSWKEMFPC